MFPLYNTTVDCNSHDLTVSVVLTDVILTDVWFSEAQFDWTKQSFLILWKSFAVSD